MIKEIHHRARLQNEIEKHKTEGLTFITSKDRLLRNDDCVSDRSIRRLEKAIRRNGTGKYAMRPVGRESVANRLLCSSAWSDRTGKRMDSS